VSAAPPRTEPGTSGRDDPTSSASVDHLPVVADVDVRATRSPKRLVTSYLGVSGPGGG
jgi:hypothetical protein